ncbi:hypothetical protein B0P06_005283 [Clostridium saccharoperbutylacetonicum]|uniref:NUMOD4 motif/HNH endonuclease n=1 Tax=Clostridium saccharoperbutylacetonicum N1-4(HMT) TaxID=931276 RepID=M1MEV5_9CLOT|nr:NUMOD4 domain-containing protein [Clostridium saccharoperbutylacetonicum]AGF56449.1 NUMOD4 motif/HNH endonuclease [Clostridium saccharoperbutylacetonicum N1-4(HMT)]NRT62804.1 hypothetical protein [Clostridium saccharoperbutylacetonicum]NSB26158.1 hypothetical protein [Clostridium saccharoperbutylacetonicum]NSB45512.1 hypothetical protein [Clostridium saccharoperbutylacetonicum]
MEAWKEIKGFEGMYSISNLGNVFSVKSNKLLSVRESKEGYLRVNLNNQGKRYTFTVHRLVLESFDPIVNMDEFQVNHINEIKCDNRLSNLEWATPKENINHGKHNNKIRNYRSNNSGNCKKKVICTTTGKPFNSISEAARYYGIKAKSNITYCAKGLAQYCGILEDGRKLEWMYI